MHARCAEAGLFSVATVRNKRPEYQTLCTQSDRTSRKSTRDTQVVPKLRRLLAYAKQLQTPYSGSM